MAVKGYPAGPPDEEYEEEKKVGIDMEGEYEKKGLLLNDLKKLVKVLEPRSDLIVEALKKLKKRIKEVDIDQRDIDIALSDLELDSGAIQFMVTEFTSDH